MNEGITMKCTNCKTEMKEVNREYVLVEVDLDELTEGQMADYMAAELSGDYEEWGVTEVTYECEKCSNVVIGQVDGCQVDNTMEYNHKPKPPYDRISRRWRERVGKVKEYEVVEKEEIESEFTPFLSFGLDHIEYQKAQRLKQKLIKKYRGKSLDDIIKGEELNTKKGNCYYIENQEKINLSVIIPDEAKKRILSDLKLIYGIGEITEQFLKEEGYETIEDLIEHPRFGSEANKFLEIIDGCDTCQIVDWIGHWFPRSHPLILNCSAFHNKEDFVFFDIETMGLFNRPIILFGVASISDNQISINQYLLRDIKEEPAALTGFLSHLKKDSVFITFNGRTFDIPYVKERLAYYRMRGNLEKPHFDILHFSRRAWRERLPNCRLTTIEKHLFGIERKDDVPSALVPDFYETYIKTKKIGPIVPIVEHNKQDLITLANIFSKLHEEWM